MMSAVGGGRGSPKSRQEEHNQLICDSDKGGRGQKSENFADVICGSPETRGPSFSKDSDKAQRALKPPPLLALGKKERKEEL